MNDPSNGAEIREIGGVKMHRLSPSDQVKLSNLLQQRARDRIKANCAANGVAVEFMTAMMNESDSRIPNRGDIVDYAISVEGQTEVHRIALGRAQSKEATPEDVDKLGLDLSKMFGDACWLMYIETKPKGNGEANPPGGASVSGTGSDAPSSSAS